MTGNERWERLTAGEDLWRRHCDECGADLMVRVFLSGGKVTGVRIGSTQEFDPGCASCQRLLADLEAALGGPDNVTTTAGKISVH